VELTAGIATALFGLSIYIFITIKDASIQTVNEPSARSVVLMFLMLVVPGVLMAIGSYVQGLRRKHWGAALVFIGGVLTFYLVIPITWFLFAYTNNAWGKLAVVADVGMLVVVSVSALISTIGSLVFRNQFD
jgi:membrane associated rhomboid family serine protease